MHYHDDTSIDRAIISAECMSVYRQNRFRRIPVGSIAKWTCSSTGHVQIGGVYVTATVHLDRPRSDRELVQAMLDAEEEILKDAHNPHIAEYHGWTYIKEINMLIWNFLVVDLPDTWK